MSEPDYEMNRELSHLSEEGFVLVEWSDEYNDYSASLTEKGMNAADELLKHLLLKDALLITLFLGNRLLGMEEEKRCGK